MIMTKFLFFAIATGIFFFASCSSDSDSASAAYSSMVKSCDYDSKNPIIEIGNLETSLTVSGNLGGGSVYLVNVNSTGNSISGAKGKYISSNISSDSGNPEINKTLGNVQSRQIFARNFVPSKDVAKILKNHIKSLPSRSVLKNTSTIPTVTQISPKIDSTKKDIYVDTNVSLNEFASKKATLRAIGTYCYVWVVDGYCTQNYSEVATKFASKFDEIYPVVRNVFGEESDCLIYYATGENLNMESYSDTGKKVNIVIYDIGNDSNSSVKSGVLGYFYSKDYVFTSSAGSTGSDDEIFNYSNKGKYFYIDSEYASSSSTFGITISTLAHEFQHMINFNQKSILKNLDAGTAYNEMLSMICEDMMQEKLGIHDEDSPKSRLQEFNALYFYSGLTEYNSSAVTVSYATNYAFGAWLCRNYGGAALAKEMIKNNKTDNESIVAAVNSLNGTSYKFDDLFKQFLLALTGNEKYTMNKNAKESLSCGGYTYPMKAIDLWSDDYSLTSDGFDYSQLKTKLSPFKYESYDWKGPFLLSENCYPETLRPEHGFFIQKIEGIPSGTTKRTFNFKMNLGSNLSAYLIIQ